MIESINPEEWRSRVSLSSIPDVRSRVERILSFDHGEEYPFDHPPGDFRPIDGPISVDEHEDRAPGNPRKGRSR